MQHKHQIQLGRQALSLQQNAIRQSERVLRVQRELMKEAVSLMLENQYEDAEDLLIGYLKEVGEL